MVVANGQGEMKGKLFRIAHLGYFDYLDAIGVIGALEHVLAKVAPSHQLRIGRWRARRAGSLCRAIRRGG